MLEKITENIHENKESSKLLNPEEYFQKITKEERRNFNVKEIYQDGIKHGMEEKDIEAAINLSACIFALHIKNIVELSLKSTPRVKKINENNEFDTSEKWVKSTQELLMLSVAMANMTKRTYNLNT